MKKKRNKPGKPGNWQGVLQFLVILFAVVQLQAIFGGSHAERIPYSRFKEMLHEGLILQVDIYDTSLEGRYFKGNPDSISDPLPELPGQPDAPRRRLNPERLKAVAADRFASIRRFSTLRVEDRELTRQLDRAGVQYKGEQRSLLLTFLLEWILPPAIIVLVWIFLMRKMGGFGPDVLSFGKSRARFNPEKQTGITFADVAGLDEAKEELQEVVFFLREPERFQRLGARIPKGVLLIGPPGCGKTLLAKAIAGEADVPFFSISGSDFVEMFVGVGAARVRDLFTQAKAKTPCIIFIDEIDAIGKLRGGHPLNGNDEREQTLNALLVEMDGFDPNTNIIILAATNRPDVLDTALMRPGRFDRQIVVDPSDSRGRQSILEVHAQGKPLGDDVDLKELALHTPGFSGADLANLMNEAALLAARRDRSAIRQQDLRDAMERVMTGPERKSRRIGDEERKIIAYHEAGHALVATRCPKATPVAKISIVPRGHAALGYTLHLPDEDRYLITRGELLDQIAVALGGRVAEELVFQEISTGAQNDLEKVTEMARSMVCRYGMSDAVGPMAFTRETMAQRRFVYDPQDESFGRSMGQTIDNEVKRIIENEYQRVRNLLERDRELLQRLAMVLLEREVISRDELTAILSEPTGEQELNEEPIESL